MIKIGDKIICDNGHTYTIGKGNNQYAFALIDEFGEEVTLITEYYLIDCMPWYNGDQSQLCVRSDYNDNLRYTYIKEYIDCEEENVKNTTVTPKMRLEKFIKDNSGIWDLEDTYEFIMEHKKELLELMKKL